MPWFAVRSFIRGRPLGRPVSRDLEYKRDIAALEERVVLFKARNADAALRKGHRDAQRYARQKETTNVYGQRVVHKPLRYIEAYEMFDDPGDGVEIFSAIEIITSAENERQLLQRKVGDQSGPRTARMFIAGRLTRDLDERVGSKRW